MKRMVWQSGFAALAFVLGGVGPASAGVITLTNSTPGIFDASSGTRSVAVTGLEPGYEYGIVTDVNVHINFAKFDGESFSPPYPTGTPYYNEIHFQLTSPSATTVQLIQSGSFNSGSGGFDGTITFDDDGLLVVNFNVSQPSAGTFRPTGPGSLADFNGQLAAGTWTLLIQDTTGADALRFRNMDLEITTEGGLVSEVPEPASLLLLATGIAGLVAHRRRRTVR